MLRAKIKIVICDPLDKDGMDILRSEKNFRVVEAIQKPPSELKRILKDAAGAIVRSGTKLTADIIKEARQLRIIGRAGVGLDNVDVTQASKYGVVVVNTPAGNTISAAEHTMTLLLALARNIAAAHTSIAEGRWDRKKFMGVEIFDKTLGLVGLGRIGAEVAKRAQSFGMKVLAYDPFLQPEQAHKLGVTLESFERVLRNSDFISLHVPLTQETRNIIDANAFKKMRDGARIINCARGGLIDEKALLTALDNKDIAGAALDVFEKEPPGKQPLLQHPLVLATPHLGASTEEAQVKVSIDIARTVADFLKGKGVRNAVNMPSLEPEVLKQMQPYLSLSEKMGHMHAQLVSGQILRVSVRFNGEVATYPTAPMTVALVKGLLTPVLAENVNYVNACILAKERGIQITESLSPEPGDFSNLIHVKVKTTKRTLSIAGTVHWGSDARIVMIDDLRIELQAKGNILYIENRDVPGMVGRIGTVLGKHRINIADMTLGRDRLKRRARTLISVDGKITPGLLQKIRRLKNIIDAKPIQL